MQAPPSLLWVTALTLALVQPTRVLAAHPRDLSNGQTAGVAVGVTAFGILVILCVWWCCRRRRHALERTNLMLKNPLDEETGTHEHASTFVPPIITPGELHDHKLHTVLVADSASLLRVAHGFEQESTGGKGSKRSTKDGMVENVSLTRLVLDSEQQGTGGNSRASSKKREKDSDMEVSRSARIDPRQEVEMGVVGVMEHGPNSGKVLQWLEVAEESSSGPTFVPPAPPPSKVMQQVNKSVRRSGTGTGEVGDSSATSNPEGARVPLLSRFAQIVTATATPAFAAATTSPEQHPVAGVHYDKLIPSLPGSPAPGGDRSHRTLLNGAQTTSRLTPRARNVSDPANGKYTPRQMSPDSVGGGSGAGGGDESESMSCTLGRKPSEPLDFSDTLVCIGAFRPEGPGRNSEAGSGIVFDMLHSEHASGHQVFAPESAAGPATHRSNRRSSGSGRDQPSRTSSLAAQPPHNQTHSASPSAFSNGPDHTGLSTSQTLAASAQPAVSQFQPPASTAPHMAAGLLALLQRDAASGSLGDSPRATEQPWATNPHAQRSNNLPRVTSAHTPQPLPLPPPPPPPPPQPADALSAAMAAAAAGIAGGGMPMSQMRMAASAPLSAGGSIGLGGASLTPSVSCSALGTNDGNSAPASPMRQALAGALPSITSDVTTGGHVNSGDAQERRSAAYLKFSAHAAPPISAPLGSEPASDRTPSATPFHTLNQAPIVVHAVGSQPPSPIRAATTTTASSSPTIGSRPVTGSGVEPFALPMPLQSAPPRRTSSVVISDATNDVWQSFMTSPETVAAVASSAPNDPAIIQVGHGGSADNSRQVALTAAGFSTTGAAAPPLAAVAVPLMDIEQQAPSTVVRQPARTESSDKAFVSAVAAEHYMQDHVQAGSTAAATEAAAAAARVKKGVLGAGSRPSLRVERAALAAANAAGGGGNVAFGSRSPGNSP